jgi:hypothetical protein
MEILNNLCILVFIKLMVLSCSGFSAHWHHPCGVAGRLFKIQKWRQDTVRAGDQSRQIQCTNPIVEMTSESISAHYYSYRITVYSLKSLFFAEMMHSSHSWRHYDVPSLRVSHDHCSSVQVRIPVLRYTPLLMKDKRYTVVCLRKEKRYSLVRSVLCTVCDKLTLVNQPPGLPFEHHVSSRPSF